MAASGNTSSTAGGVSLTSKTPILGQRLYVIIAITVVVVTVILVVIFLCIRRNLNTKRRRRMRVKHSSGLLPLVSAAINVESIEKTSKISVFEKDDDEKEEIKPIIKVVEGKIGNTNSGSNESGTSRSEGASSSVSAESLSNLGWGKWYSLNEIEIATNNFADENVIGEGGYGIVYKSVLRDDSVVAVKNLLNNKGQAEKEFKVEVEAIGKVRHKNLVGLMGFCADGAKRLLVYEYVDNGNLEQWLHGDVGPISPLTWDIRMKIAVGTAKGLAYLHEGLEPKVVHRDVKSSNILLDRKWNAKVSDFGLAKLLGPEKSYVTTRVMGTFGLMNLVDWFKGMVASRRGEELLDPKISVQPSPRALKRVLLVCLRCIDMDANKRPKMGQIVHMLEADEFPFRTEPRPPRDTAASKAALAN
ncbi:Protein kinase, ATP binding site-containing protein [Cynara cardunculus var. scolymus]|uniref:non-specific serine/threonine protein kinase n=1 Tax=Cynara cardunculus var. scolymus TaxID=59895 RepID=A0A103YKG9_CYNCS|nr:Protein kinase, ATP binding site-containing protein [Cynara cardunculus var. scolymus]